MTIDNEHNDDHGGGPMSERDDAEFALFLKKDGELSRQLHALPHPESPPELDAAILARIGAALAEERVPAAANDAAVSPDAMNVANPAANPIRSRLRSRWAPFWRLSIGVAAGILVVTVLRMTWRPDHDAVVPQVALRDRVDASNKVDEAKKNDTAGDAVVDMSPQRVAPPPAAPEVAPKAAAAQDRVETPSFARAPADAEPPRVSLAPPVAAAPPVAMAAQVAPAPLMRAAPTAKSANPAYAAASPSRQSEVQRVEITGLAVRRADRETASPVQVISAAELKQSGTSSADVLDKARAKPPLEVSGTELAWTRDPARSAVRKESAAEAQPDVAQAYGVIAPPAEAPAVPAPAATAVVPAAPPARDVAVYDAPKPAAIAPAPDIAYRATAPAQFALQAPAPIVSAAPPARAVTPIMPNTASPGAAAVEIAGVPAAKPSQAANAKLRRLSLTDEERMRRKPSTWLTLIEQKLQAQNGDAAREEWEKFRKIYPDYPVKRALAAQMKSLQEKK